MEVIHKLQLNQVLSSTRMEDNRINLPDLTFLVPLRIDSKERIDNINTLIKYTFLHFATRFIILEADCDQKYLPESNPEGFRYEFIKDEDKVFHRTKWINRLITMANTPFIGVWDADSIAPPEQIINTINRLRSDNSALSFPYDGRFYSCDRVTSNMFKKLLNIEILLNRVSVMELMHGYHSVGGAFVVNKEKYLNAGAENENFYGWGPEDTGRVKRFEIMGLPIYNSIGTLFHLFHPLLENSWFANDDAEKKNRKELQNTCKLTSV